MSDDHIINEPIEFTIRSQEIIGERLDKHVSKRFSTYSRHYLQKLILDGHILVNGKQKVSRYRLREGDVLTIILPDRPVKLRLDPEDLNLEVIHEDPDILIISKRAGMVVHPADRYRHLTGTVVNAVLFHCQNSLSGINGVLRPGIVHRLDRDTSGLLIVAKTDKAHKHMAKLMKDRLIHKEYLTLVKGKLTPKKGSIDAPIGRHAVHRHKKAVGGLESQEALTHYEVIKYLEGKTSGETLSLLRVRIITGRTHQIRVHLSSIGHPVVGDNVYGDEEINARLKETCGLDRQFLHAWHLTFKLPDERKETTFTAPLPHDLLKVLEHFGANLL